MADSDGRPGELGRAGKKIARTAADFMDGKSDKIFVPKPASRKLFFKPHPMLNFQAPDFIGKPSKEIAAALQASFVPIMLDKLPFARGQGLLILYGSAARGQMIIGSDADLLLFLPAQLSRSREQDVRKPPPNFGTPIPLIFHFPTRKKRFFRKRPGTTIFYCTRYRKRPLCMTPKIFFPAGYSA